MKSLYDLKQAPKQWHGKLDQFLIRNGFSFDKVDKYVYTKVIDNDYVIYAYTLMTCLYLVQV